MQADEPALFGLAGASPGSDHRHHATQPIALGASPIVTLLLPHPALASARRHPLRPGASP
ncbi:hypothetical protein PSMK_04870 [Phycisphaera mikurensis NBRC 102666]|uniref:Uncharacterized protein n=1 Tax=Phycisphaera mikurensis (strain NBRC 102666 / KCTC 22515 / FYK2301M01) TaxID=1142394 RepID=I0IBK8_PHYMF|nr:hypothetical protein PSMK_04870 [Phycisphaera mikurensis NBRC 102666]